MASSKRSLNRLTPSEISLIKAMLALGKPAGFHAGKIQSYFTRPDRNVNPARLYEIRDGKLGADIPPASETELHDFLSMFETLPVNGDTDAERIPRLPTPAYIGVQDGQVRLVARTAIVTDQDSNLDARRLLFQEQFRLSGVLIEAWGQFQVDQRLKAIVERYRGLLSNDHTLINIFSLDTEFNILNKGIGADTEALGTIGEAQWERFVQNHFVLTDLYPEMREYRERIACLNDDIQIPEAEAQQITEELLKPDAEQYVAPEVPQLIRDRLNEEVNVDREADRKRKYDVVAMISRMVALVNSVIHYLPRAANAATAAHTLWSRVWAPLKEFLRGCGFI